jgi:hypothetical protein
MKLLLQYIEGSNKMYNASLSIDCNVVYIGHFALLRDGCYYFWPNNIDYHGYFGEQELKLILEKIQELNKKQ